MKKILSAVLGFFSLGIAWVGVAYAQSQPPITTSGQLQGFFCSILGWFFWIVLTISVIMILYAAFTYATAGDNQEKTSKARKTITYAAIGIAVALIAFGFPSLIASVFPTPPNVSSAPNCISGGGGVSGPFGG